MAKVRESNFIETFSAMIPKKSKWGKVILARFHIFCRLSHLLNNFDIQISNYPNH